jgi:hypothetical protein
VSREFEPKIAGLLGVLFSQDSRDFGGRGEEGAISTIGRAHQVFLRPIRVHRFLLPPILHLLLRLEVSILGVVGVTIQLIRNPKLKKMAFQVIIFENCWFASNNLPPSDR